MREIRGFVEALRGKQQGGRLRPGLAVHIWTDSHAAYACCSRMRGSESVFAEVRNLYLRAWAEEVCLSFVWVPSSHEALVAADHLSKWEDGSDWQFSCAFARQQMFKDVGEPDMDCLASAHAQMCSVYFSVVYDGKCAAVDGLLQRWDRWPRRVLRFGKPLCWVFPPTVLLGQAIRKIEREKADALVVMARNCPPEVIGVMHRLPIIRKWQLNGPHRAMVRPTKRVPMAAAPGGWKTPLQAVLVKW